jgi:hypothetical protein
MKIKRSVEKVKISSYIKRGKERKKERLGKKTREIEKERKCRKRDS